MTKYIVITSIFPPSEAVRLFAENLDYSVIVIGDKKTPTNWHCKNVEYISVNKQESFDYELVNCLPFNHYCRKMLGYLRAIENGAESIVDTDDDNIPKTGWSFPNFEGQTDFVRENRGFINVYQLYTEQNIWPRGLPLNLISTKFQFENDISKINCNVGIWQGLADEDPDVDAIYRLTDNRPCYFKERQPIVLGKGTVSPFNSQNTLVRKELFPLMYLPTYVTFRFTDILRGLVAQPIMWVKGYHLGFTNATVVQKRNPHDFMKDFQSEIPMYLNCEQIIDAVSASVSSTASIEENLYEAYCALLTINIVEKAEITTLTAWLNDLEKIRLSH